VNTYKIALPVTLYISLDAESRTDALAKAYHELKFPSSQLPVNLPGCLYEGYIESPLPLITEEKKEE